MKLEELLDELRVNILRDDAVLAAGPSDQLWTDDALVRYINDAQSMWARKTLALRDASTADVVEVPLSAGVAAYDLHKSILSVVSARFDDNEVDLPRFGRSNVDLLLGIDPPFFDAAQIAAISPGPPLGYSTDERLNIDDESAVVLTVMPAPSADEDGLTLFLRVARLPLEDFDIEDTEAECELPSIYQLDMLEWAAYRALMNSDIDGHSDAAKEHKKRFEDSTKEVLKDIRRKMRQPQRFAFGTGGFTWER